MKLKNVNLVTSMKQVYVPPAIVKQVLTIMDNLDKYIQEQDIQGFSDQVKLHIQTEGHVHEDFSGESFQEEILKKLYIEWKQKYPNDTYEEFLFKLVDEIHYFLNIVPDIITDEDKAKYILTICSFVYYFNKHHNLQSINDIHNQLFIDKISDILNIIKRFDYYKYINFYINKFNINYYLLNKINSETTRDPNYSEPTNVDKKESQTNYFSGILSDYEKMDYFISKYQELLDWQYNWENRRTIGLIRFFTKENFPYYQALDIQDKIILSPNMNIFINFTFNHCEGITHIFAFRSQDGSLYFSLYYNSDDRTFNILINKLNQPMSTLITNIFTIYESDINQYKNYKFMFNFDIKNNVLTVEYMIDNNKMINTITINNNLQGIKYVPEFLEIAFKFDSEDKININSFHEIITYDHVKYPTLKNTLFKLN